MMPRDTLLDLFRDYEALEGTAFTYFDGVRTWSRSYEELGRGARAFAAALASAGIRKGDKVLLWSENRPEWIVALWGCLLEGIAVVPIDYRASFELVSRVHAVVNSRLLVVGSDVEPAASNVPVWKLAQLDWSGRGEATDVVLTRDDLAEIIFTSGATADPKGVLITHRNLLANIVPIETEVKKYLRYAKPFQPIRFVNLLPLSHLFGQSMAAFIPPLLAGETLFLRSYNPEVITREIRNHRISVMVSVPKMLETMREYVTARFPEVLGQTERMHWMRRWWKYRRVHRLFGWKFWAFIAGGAPLDPDLEEFWSRLGFVVIQGYGLTETAPIVTLNHPFHARKGSVGKRIAGVEIRIAEDGEVLVRGENVTQGYFGGEGPSTRTFEDGWLHTGDIGDLDSDGNLHILGRKKEMIVTAAGMKIFPEDVERVLNEVKGVKDSAAVGKDRVHAVLVLEPGADANAVVRAANERLEPHQKISGVSVWSDGPLPRTEGTQKLRRVAIQEWALAGKAVPGKHAEDELTSLLRRYAPDREITEGTTLDELGLGSLDRVELLLELEQRLGRRVDESAISAATTVEHLREPVAPAGQEDIAYPRWTLGRMAAIVRWLLLNVLVFPLTRYYAKMNVRGTEHLEEGPVVFALNHQSHMDVPVFFLALPARRRYHAAPAMSQEFFDAHFHPERHGWAEILISRFTYILAALCFRAFPLSQRGANTRDAVEYMGKLVSGETSILIFPEGHLTETGEVGKFQAGVALLASKLHVPVVPVRLKGLDRVLHRSAKWATRGRVEVSFGKPIVYAGEEPRAFAQNVEDAVKEL